MRPASYTLEVMEVESMAKTIIAIEVYNNGKTIKLC